MILLFIFKILMNSFKNSHVEKLDPKRIFSPPHGENNDSYIKKIFILTFQTNYTPHYTKIVS